MQKRSIFKLLCLALLLMSVLLGCVSPSWRRWHPTAQPSTIWRTKDNRVVFSVKEKGADCIGTLQTDKESVDIVLCMSPLASFIEICYLKDYMAMQSDEPIPYFALWKTKHIRANEFVVEVVETVYFESGQTLTFSKGTGGQGDGLRGTGGRFCCPLVSVLYGSGGRYDYLLRPLSFENKKYLHTQIARKRIVNQTNQSVDRVV